MNDHALESAARRSPRDRPELRIVIGYVLFSSLWKIGSDWLLADLVSDRVEAFKIQLIKGLSFSLILSLLLYLVLRRAFGGWRRSEDLRMQSMHASMENLRKLSSSIQHLREEERTRISREIHDELGQHLTGLKMQLRLIEDHLSHTAGNSTNRAIDELVEAAAMVDDTIASVRRIASGLRPLVLDHLGLAAALDEEAEQFSRRTGIRCFLTVCGIDREIPSEVETTTFRIFQESLTNVARHAHARRIDAEFSTRDNVLTLTIQDDGVGIEPTVLEHPDSLGLVGMSERAADVGGSVKIDTSTGRGTKVVLTIPLDPAKPPAPAPDL